MNQGRKSLRLITLLTIGYTFDTSDCVDVQKV